MSTHFLIYPGGEIVAKGLRDLDLAKVSPEALCLLAARPRLAQLGIEVVDTIRLPKPYEHRLFEAMEELYGAGAHSQYNAMRRRFASFANSYRPDP